MNLAFVGLLLPAFSLAQTTSEADAAKLEAKKKAEEEKAACQNHTMKPKMQKLKLQNW
jgi:hypothetical protein